MVQSATKPCPLACIALVTLTQVHLSALSCQYLSYDFVFLQLHGSTNHFLLSLHHFRLGCPWLYFSIDQKVCNLYCIVRSFHLLICCIILLRGRHSALAVLCRSPNDKSVLRAGSRLQFSAEKAGNGGDGGKLQFQFYYHILVCWFDLIVH